MNINKLILSNSWKQNTTFQYITTNYITHYKIDHLSFRSFDKNIIVNNLSNYGYQPQNDYYKFTRHNAEAIWLKNDKSIIPRIFISEYNGIYQDNALLNSNLDIDKISYHINNQNQLLSYHLYQDIYQLNQYLAWTLIYRHYVVNHFAIEIENIEQLYNTLQQDTMISLSGNLQVSEDSNLLQFSTKAENNLVKFTEGFFDIPTNFLEFVERKDNREGFSEKNADIIFDSTKGNIS